MTIQKRTTPPRKKPSAPTVAAPAAALSSHNPQFNPRELTSHKINGLNEAIRILVRDDAATSGAHHDYEMKLEGLRGPIAVPIHFQKGAISDVGHDGFTNEALLAVVEDRLACFQKGPFACEANEDALTSVRDALAVLKLRAQARSERGVEGTHTP